MPRFLLMTEDEEVVMQAGNLQELEASAEELVTEGRLAIVFEKVGNFVSKGVSYQEDPS